MFGLTKLSVIALGGLMIGLCTWSACGGGQTTSKPKKRGKMGFVTGRFIHQDETYSGIKQNVLRLQTMLSGYYACYKKEEADRVFRPWRVNDGKDSIVQYLVPVGEPNKIGYWIYHYQTMTSLPDEPIYELFEELTEINRDTIKSVFYEAPKSFNVPLETLYKEHKNAFKSLNMDSIRAGTVSKKGVYIRQNPLFFTRTTPVIALPKMEDGSQYYYRDSFATQSLGLGQQFDFFQDEKEQFRLTGYRYKYVKLATVR